MGDCEGSYLEANPPPPLPSHSPVYCLLAPAEITHLTNYNPHQEKKKIVYKKEGLGGGRERKIYLRLQKTQRVYGNKKLEYNVSKMNLNQGKEKKL